MKSDHGGLNFMIYATWIPTTTIPNTNKNANKNTIEMQNIDPDSASLKRMYLNTTWKNFKMA